MKRLKSLILVALAVFVAVAYVPSNANTASAQQSSASLSIAPKKSYVMNPGDTVNDKISVHNIDSTSGLKLYMRVIDFTYTDDTGTPKLMLDQDAEPTTWSLRSYMQIPDTIEMSASQTASADIDIHIPKNLGAGSYYSAIIYSTGAPDGSGNVGLSASGVTLVFVTVPGKVDENLIFKKLGAYDRTTKKYTFITGTEPQVIAYTLENKGNVTESPVGSIQLQSMWGKKYVVSNVNPSSSLALIGQTRTFTACIKLKSSEVQLDNTTSDTSSCKSAGLWPGMYTISADLFYGQNGNNTQEITKTAIFWYLPLWFIILVILVVLAIAFGIWRLVVNMQKRTNSPRGRKSSRLMRR